MRSVEEIRGELYRIADLPEADLAAAALDRRRGVPGLDPAAYLRCLDDVASAVSARIPDAGDPDAARDALSGGRSSSRQGLRRQRDQYYDPRNA